MPVCPHCGERAGWLDDYCSECGEKIRGVKRARDDKKKKKFSWYALIPALTVVVILAVLIGYFLSRFRQPEFIRLIGTRQFAVAYQTVYNGTDTSGIYAADLDKTALTFTWRSMVLRAVYRDGRTVVVSDSFQAFFYLEENNEALAFGINPALRYLGVAQLDRGDLVMDGRELEYRDYGKDDLVVRFLFEEKDIYAVSYETYFIYITGVLDGPSAEFFDIPETYREVTSIAQWISGI